MTCLGKITPDDILPLCDDGVRWRRSSQSEAVLYLENGLTKNHQTLHVPSQWSGLQPHRTWRHYLLPIGSYRRSKNSRKFRLRRLQSRNTKLGTYIHTDVLNSHTGYDVTGYLWSKVKKRLKMPSSTALGGISRERLKPGSQNLTSSSETIGPIKPPDTTPIPVSGWLHDTLWSCTW